MELLLLVAVITVLSFSLRTGLKNKTIKRQETALKIDEKRTAPLLKSLEQAEFWRNAFATLMAVAILWLLVLAYSK